MNPFLYMIIRLLWFSLSLSLLLQGFEFQANNNDKSNVSAQSKKKLETYGRAVDNSTIVQIVYRFKRIICHECSNRTQYQSHLIAFYCCQKIDLILNFSCCFRKFIFFSRNKNQQVNKMYVDEKYRNWTKKIFS